MKTQTLKILLSLLLPGGAMTAMAAPPDLTNGGVPGDTISFNMGATGARGWVYHTREDTSQSRQILVMSVATGSPADGILAPNDVILGADGTGAAAVNFISDARKSLGLAITAAEARDPATLSLVRWRAGVTSEVTLTLRTMGAYSASAPYNCPKSAKILKEGLSYLMGTNALGQTVSAEPAGRYSFGTLTLLAADDPTDPDNTARMDRARTEARALVPSAATMAQMMSDQRDTSSTWERGHTLIVLAEYFLATNDSYVLPAIEAYAVNIARNQSLFGTLGHIYAEKNADGSDNGPMGGVYGPVNSTGMPCFLGLLLARECGLSRPEYQSTTQGYVEAAIERTSRFFAYYAGRGSIPYGEHEPLWSGHENNGKSGLSAICFALQDNRGAEQEFFSKMAAASAAQRGEGHTGAFFNYLWAPLGAATGGEDAAASHFSRISWMLDLNRRWDGGFDYDCLTGEGPNSGAQYNSFRMSTAALLTYALPLRKLHVTGRGHDPARFLTSTDVAEASAADGYVATSARTISQLIADLGSWSPMVQRRSAEQLATRSIDTATLSQITSLATNPSSNSRVGACYTLGKISNSGTANARAATLAGLLTDPDNKVRFIAAESLRYLPDSARLSQLNAILSAAASTATPLMPFDEEDPLHFAHGRLAMLLFYSGNAYGPKGVIYGSKINSPTVINRSLLYPAIRAVAANPVGQARSTLSETYKNLTAADVNALADTLVDSIHFRAPSDKMFSGGIRLGGITALEKYNIAEGVPLSMIYMVNDTTGDAYTNALGVLKNYAGSCTTVQPDPDVIGFCQALLGGSNAAAAQAVLDAIAADTNPVTLAPFKSIQSVSADANSITLPANQTILHASASDPAKGNLVYTWRKVHGAGDVTFTPNGTASAKDATVSINNVPGKYRFEVTVSDSRGFTEVRNSLLVTQYDADGTLPSNNPPAADAQAVNAKPASVTPVTLTGTDPEGYPLVFSVTSQPAHGSLGGTAPNLTYIADSSYLGMDAFNFQVMDSEGQISSATVTIHVSGAGIKLDVYEPFDYTVGPLAGQSGGTGMSGSWADGPETPGKAYVYDQSTATTPVNYTSAGGPLSWDGVVANLPTSPATGARYVGLDAVNVDKWEACRPLARSAGAMAAENGNVLWVSAVSHYKAGGYGAHFGLALATNCFTNRSQNLSVSATYGGTTAGNGIGVGGAFNNDYITPVVFNGGNQAARTTAGATALSTAVDNIVILRFVFGETDTVQAYRFLESDSLDEADFNAKAISATGNVDENTLNILTFSSVRGAHAIDEIRIGNSFAAVIGVPPPPPDTTPPALENIVDDRGGEPVVQDTPVTYTMTFSEPMDVATVDASDFSNAGSAAIMIGQILHPSSGVFVIPVTPTSAGSLQLRIKAAAVLKDLSGNSLNTVSALADDTVITVNPRTVFVPNVVGLPQATASTNIASAGLAVGTNTQEYDSIAPAGSIISQSPQADTSVSLGSAVNLVISLGPVPDYQTWQALYPGADLSDPAADLDMDGLSNGEERIWGLDPKMPSSVNPIISPPGPAGIFSYTRRDPALTGYTYSVLTSENLAAWSEDTGAQQVSGTTDANGVQTVTVTLSPEARGTDHVFVRVRAVKVPDTP